MPDRLAKLTKMLESEPGDAFLRYGIGMEHKKAGRLDEALGWFDKTLESDAGYCYAYYQQGQTHEQRGDDESAKAAYRRGIETATRVGDAHARGELEAALEMLD